MSAVRRWFVLVAVVAACAGVFGPAVSQGDTPPKGVKKMYGLIGKLIAVEGKRDELIAILTNGTKEMPGCLSYIVAKDPAAANAIWVTEAWQDEASHKASLSQPAVREALTKGRPLIAKFERIAATEPVGGHGLTLAKP
jgi:quinol monooxygenase YgiN